MKVAGCLDCFLHTHSERERDIAGRAAKQKRETERARLKGIACWKTCAIVTGRIVPLVHQLLFHTGEKPLNCRLIGFVFSYQIFGINFLS